jgi:hypothetical protein
MTKRASVLSDTEKRRSVRAAIRDPCAARFRAGEKKTVYLGQSAVSGE